MQHICTYLPDGELYHDGEVYSLLRFDRTGTLLDGRTFATLAEAHAVGLSLYGAPHLAVPLYDVRVPS